MNIELLAISKRDGTKVNTDLTVFMTQVDFNVGRIGIRSMIGMFHPHTPIMFVTSATVESFLKRKIRLNIPIGAH